MRIRLRSAPTRRWTEEGASLCDTDPEQRTGQRLLSLLYAQVRWLRWQSRQSRQSSASVASPQTAHASPNTSTNTFPFPPLAQSTALLQHHTLVQRREVFVSPSLRAPVVFLQKRTHALRAPCITVNRSSPSRSPRSWETATQHHQAFLLEQCYGCKPVAC